MHAATAQADPPGGRPEYTAPMSALLLLSAALATPAEPPAPEEEPLDAPAGTVRSWSSELPLAAPGGQARVWPLAEGSNAWVGRLELAPGAAVPPHRDPTEETIVVLSGTGTMMLDGQAHALSPGSTVYMPAGAEVSFTNGPERLVAIQVFAGPGPASKYDGWKREWDTVPLRIAHEGPLSVACKASECFVMQEGRVLGEPVWTTAPPEEVLAPLGGIVASFGEAWLLRGQAGDHCPARYEGVCLISGVPVRSSPFGNCNAPSGLQRVRDGLALSFPGSGNPGEPGYREPEEVHLDPRTCRITARQ